MKQLRKFFYETSSQIHILDKSICTAPEAAFLGYNHLMNIKTKKLLIPFFTAGHPSLDSTGELIKLFDQNQADYIEIGLAHSDALADGPVIQQSSHQALTNGINYEILCQQVLAVKDQIKNSKLVLFSYFNPLLAIGLEKVTKSWKAAGGNAILVPDLPFEESEELLSLCEKADLNLVFLIAPTSTEERIEKIAKISRDFIYLVSVTGVTGVRQGLQNDLSNVISSIKKVNPALKVVIGFGIASPENAKEAIAQGADGVVVGSAIVKLLNENSDPNFTSLKSLIASLREAV